MLSETRPSDAESVLRASLDIWRKNVFSCADMSSLVALCLQRRVSSGDVRAANDRRQVLRGKIHLLGKGPKEWERAECWSMHKAALNILAIKLPPSLSKTVKTSQPCSHADLDVCCWHTIPQLRSGIIPVRGIRPWEEREKNVISHPGLVRYRGALTAWNVLVQGSLDNALENGYFS